MKKSEKQTRKLKDKLQFLEFRVDDLESTATQFRKYKRQGDLIVKILTLFFAVIVFFFLWRFLENNFGQ